jgi:hypothetical protein
MAFKEMEWEFSKVEEKEEPDMQSGLHYLKIVDANMDRETDRYSVTVQSLGEADCDATCRLTYFLTKKHSHIGALDNAKAVGTVVSLGIALAGRRIGLPRPDSIIGGVVMADIVYSTPNAEGKSYANIYKYEPVPSALQPFSDIDQYYTDEGAQQ